METSPFFDCYCISGYAILSYNTHAHSVAMVKSCDRSQQCTGPGMRLVTELTVDISRAEGVWPRYTVNNKLTMRAVATPLTMN